MPEPAPSEAIARLLSQHRRLRRLLASASEAARCLLEGAPMADELSSLLVAIRAAFDEHNRYEAMLLEPMLRASDSIGPQRIARMIDEHQEEHVMFGEFLARDVSVIAPALADFVEELGAHMDAEERVFLHPRALGVSP
jgi:iron-sulfur cluster repair protein YtfE (RIC family)